MINCDSHVVHAFRNVNLALNEIKIIHRETIRIIRFFYFCLVSLLFFLSGDRRYKEIYIIKYAKWKEFFF